MNSRFDPATGFLIEVRPQPFPWVNVILFLVTCLSTLVVGAFAMADFQGIGPGVAFDGFRSHPSTLLRGLPFSMAIMGILFAHEMGHYLTCRYYGVDASLPYFIPFPSLVGTMGAFIRIRAPFYDRGSLLDVGVAGPIAGFVVAVFALVISISQARFVPFDAEFVLGEPIIFKMVAYFMNMTPPAGMDLHIHPVGFAAWFGFLATALNLLPAAQLDGGHISYALFRRHHKWISRGVVIALVPLSIFYCVSWILWIILLLVLKLRHPPTIDDSIPLLPRQVALGITGYVLLVLCFTPAPMPVSLIDFVLELTRG
jgi:membrane-associated protease RseP (regulator of RpoE activity)